MACTGIPIEYRLLYGFLAREGCRISEALAADLPSFDLPRGIFRLDVNKTHVPRVWALDPAVARALRRWSKRNPRPAAHGMFVDAAGVSVSARHLAEKFREHLALAGLDRVELFVTTIARSAIRIQDLRATFVTLAFARGKSEAWIQDRTGHTTSAMLNRYRRTARMVSELALGDLGPLDELIPDLPADLVDDDGIQNGIQRYRYVFWTIENTGAIVLSGAAELVGADLKSPAARREGTRVPQGLRRAVKTRSRRPPRKAPNRHHEPTVDPNWIPAPAETGVPGTQGNVGVGCGRTRPACPGWTGVRIKEYGDGPRRVVAFDDADGAAR